MDTKRDSAHLSQNEDNFPSYSLGLEFLNEAERVKNNGKVDSASEPWRFASLSEGEMQQILTERHSGKIKQKTNWSVSTFKGKLTTRFNNMRTLTFKAQPTNAFFATVNQVFGDSSQLPTTVERAVIKWLSTVQITKQCSAVVGSLEDPPNTWLTAAKNPFVGWASNFRVRMLLKGAVNFFRFKILKFKTRAFNTKIEIKPNPVLLNILLTANNHSWYCCPFFASDLMHNSTGYAGCW